MITQTSEFPTENNVECKSPGLALALNTSSAEEEYGCVQQNVGEINQKRDFEKAENGDENEHMHHEEQQKENATSTGKKTLHYNATRSGPSIQRFVQSVSQSLRRTPLSAGKGQSKVLQKADTDDISKQKRSTNERAHIEASEAIPLTSSSVLQRSPSLRAARGNFTVPQPFALATDKRASLGNRPAISEVAKSSSKQPGNGCATTCSLMKKPQVFFKAMARPSLVKATHLEVVKTSNELKVKNIVEVEPTTILQSLPSSPTKSKEELNSKSMIGFNFKCDERAEKRKEFYSKLEEKLNAKQAERNEIQAKTQEEMEAEIKELRKSLTFKATPMPSFYQEAPPPKAELKKIPPTRAKSPKLGRRKSVNGLVAHESLPFSHAEEVHNGHLKSDNVSKSLDYCKNMNVPIMKTNSSTPKLHIRKSLIKRPSEKTIRLKFEGEFDKSKSEVKSYSNGQPSCLNESVEVSGSKVEGTTESTSSTVVKMAISTIGELIDTDESNRVSDDLISDNVQEHISKIDPASVDEVKEDGKDNQNPENQVVNAIHETQGVVVVGIEKGKLRVSKVSEPIVHSEVQESNEKAVRSFKRERLKASTPTISSLRREHIRARPARIIAKNNQVLSSTNTDVAVAS